MVNKKNNLMIQGISGVPKGAPGSGNPGEISVDQTIKDGSPNAVSGNAVHDALFKHEKASTAKINSVQDDLNGAKIYFQDEIDSKLNNISYEVIKAPATQEELHKELDLRVPESVTTEVTKVTEKMPDSRITNSEQDAIVDDIFKTI